MILQVENKVFKAHRNVLAAWSPYFDTMCYSGMEEGLRNMATIECTTADAMEEILNYIYTGEICISSDNVEPILRGADHFLIPALREYCCEFLSKKMDASNCLVVKQLADLYRFGELYNRSSEFVRNQFMHVITDGNDDLMALTVDQLIDLITDEKLRVEKEESIYELVLKWTKFDLASRKEYFPELLSHVRLPQLNRQYLMSYVEVEELIRENPKCMALFADAKHQTDTTRRSYCSDSPVLKPRKGRLTDVVVITGGVSTNGPLAETFGYIIEEDRWTALPGLPNELRFHAASTLHSCMYVAGGSSNGLVSNKVHRYDPVTNSWTNTAFMQTPREYLALAACNGCLYAMGGIRWDNVLRSVEKYDPELDKWTFVAPVSTPRYAMHLVTIDDRYIYAIGGRDGTRQPVTTVERYDTETDEWCTLQSFPVDGQPWEFPVVESQGDKIFVTDLATKALCFNTERKCWTQEIHNFASLPERTCFTYCTLDRIVFVFGGWKSHVDNPYTSNSTLPTDACIYNSVLGLWSSISSPPASTLASACCVLQIPYEFLMDAPPPSIHSY
uniref:Kelch-like protein 3-like n=1 Tax=Saccoglossus kowalevskii TaxID=10224 RepID=A0ABM0GWX4_SACKO|nr:PREDICTED: kelch-like protein 3-like [Saccoglossus kowalevskii]